MTQRLSIRLLRLAILARGNGKGLTQLGYDKLSDEIAACAGEARTLEATNGALQDELLAEAALPRDEEPEEPDPRQLDLTTAGEVIVMPRLFPRNYGITPLRPR